MTAELIDPGHCVPSCLVISTIISTIIICIDIIAIKNKSLSQAGGKRRKIGKKMFNMLKVWNSTLSPLHTTYYKLPLERDDSKFHIIPVWLLESIPWLHTPHSKLLLAHDDSKFHSCIRIIPMWILESLPLLHTAYSKVPLAHDDSVITYGILNRSFRDGESPCFYF